MKKAILFFTTTVVIFFMTIGSNGLSACSLKEHIVKKGDRLAKLVPPEQLLLVKKINRIDGRHLQIGQRLLIPDCKNLGENDFAPVPREIKEKKTILVVFLGRQYFGFYREGKLLRWGPVCSGMRGRETPTGKFKVLWKAKKYVSHECNAPMPFAVCFEAKRGLFLHQQAMVGRPASHGCVRLLREDARWLFKKLKKGDKIIIVKK